jgi:tetratricopeptide (TPR) repeat protein
MNLGQIKDAVDKFENTKRAIENEIVYENPLLFVNICNLLGNCYLQQNQLKKALDNYESSLCLINRMVENEVSPEFTGKLCLNIAMI